MRSKLVSPLLPILHSEGRNLMRWPPELHVCTGRVVQTNPNVGVTDSDADTAIRILLSDSHIDVERWPAVSETESEDEDMDEDKQWWRTPIVIDEGDSAEPMAIMAIMSDL